MIQILHHQGMRSMDPDGWVPVTALMQELNCERDAIDMIYRSSSNGRRRRYELWDEGTRTMIRAAYKRSYEPDGREHLAIGNRGENKDKHVGRPSTRRSWTDEEWTAWIDSEGHGAEEGKGWWQSKNSGQELLCCKSWTRGV